MAHQRGDDRALSSPVRERAHKAVMEQSSGNIGLVGVRTRALVGTVMGIIGIVIGVGFLQVDVTRAWRLLLFIPFWLAALGLFQALEKT